MHEDVRTLERLPHETSLVVAGFPCQDLSQAGMTKGIAGSRSGLVGEVVRLIEDQRTPWVLLENVPFMLQLAHGEAMNVITTAFEELGYRWAYRVVDARAFGRPQRRRRVYFLASREGDPRTVLFADEAGAPIQPKRTRIPSRVGSTGQRAFAGSAGPSMPSLPSRVGRQSAFRPSCDPLPDGRVVTPDIRDAERLQGFPKDWTKAVESVAKRGLRWKLVGNAVSVPAAAGSVGG